MIAPKLRFKEFYGDWSALKYKDVLTIKYGKDHKSLDEGDIPVYGTGGVMRYVDQYLYEGESILIGRKGTIDQPKYVNEKFWTVDTLFYTEIKKNALPLFLFQHALQVNWLGLNEATGVPSLNTTSINNVDIYLPSKEEQTKIATFLSAVDEKISQLNQKHELLSQYKQGMMQKLFSQQIRFKADDGSEFGEWEEKALKTIARIYDGTHQTPNYVEDGVPFYSVEHVTANNFSKTKFIAEDVFLDELKRVQLEKNDILLTRIGDIGTSKLIDWDVRASFYVSLALIKVDKNNNSSFVNQYIKSIFFQKELHERTIHVAFPKKINLGEIGLCLIRLPCLAEQTKIDNFLSAIDQKIEVVAQQIEQAKTWKKGLLQQMFV